jgi:hypothetical protein
LNSGGSFDFTGPEGGRWDKLDAFPDWSWGSLASGSILLTRVLYQVSHIYLTDSGASLRIQATDCSSGFYTGSQMWWPGFVGATRVWELVVESLWLRKQLLVDMLSNVALLMQSLSRRVDVS